MRQLPQLSKQAEARVAIVETEIAEIVSCAKAEAARAEAYATPRDGFTTMGAGAAIEWDGERQAAAKRFDAYAEEYRRLIRSAAQFSAALPLIVEQLASRSWPHYKRYYEARSQFWKAKSTADRGALGKQIRTARRNRGHSQPVAADKIGVSLRELQNIEAGRVATPHPGSEKAILDYISET